jgi:phenylacetate-CoA ligase
VACECIESKDGPTVWEDHFLPEIIDPETGRILPDGEMGELVLTSLTKEAMPIVRFRTRDLTRLLPPTARAFRRVAKVTGRTDDMLIIRGVNLFPSQVEELILKQPRLSPHYVLEVNRDGHLDTLTILVELKPDCALCSATDREHAAHALRHHVKSYIGVNTEVRIMDVGSLERSVGKARRVVDHRPL